METLWRVPNQAICDANWILLLVKDIRMCTVKNLIHPSCSHRITLDYIRFYRTGLTGSRESVQNYTIVTIERR